MGTCKSHVIELLTPFEEATRELSSESACVSQVLPFIETLKRRLISKSKEDYYFLSAKDTMTNGITERTENLFDNERCLLATILHPRYKLKVFIEEIRLKAKLMLLSKMAAFCNASPKTSSVVSDSDSSVHKKSRKEKSTKFEQLMREITENSDGEEGSSSDTREDELNAYLNEKIDQTENPLKFWSVKKLVYPTLAKLARKYLSPPSTSVPSERLFSKRGVIFSDRRTRLSLDKLELLVYLSSNLKCINFDY